MQSSKENLAITVFVSTLREYKPECNDVSHNTQQSRQNNNLAATPSSDAATLHNEITSTYAYVLIFEPAPKQETATRRECTLVLTPESAPDVGNSGDQQ